MVARWMANLILLLMLIGLALGIRYELMVTESSRVSHADPATIGDTMANLRRVELEPSPADSEPASPPASPVAPRSVAPRSDPKATADPTPLLGTLPSDRSPERSDSPAARPIPESVESPPVVRLSPDGSPDAGQPTMGQAQDQTAAVAAPVDRPGTRPSKAPPVGFGVDPFAPDEVPPPQAARSKTGGVPAPRGY
jgi:hypothetical protein